MVVDSKFLWFSFMVSLISRTVIAFSDYYMREERNFHRFHLLVLRFVVSVLIMVSSPNLLSILVG